MARLKSCPSRSWSFPSVQLAVRVTRLLRFDGNRLSDFLLLLPVADGGADRVLGQHRTMDLHGRKRELLHDVHVLDGESLVHSFPFDPFGGEGRRCDRGT